MILVLLTTFDLVCCYTAVLCWCAGVYPPCRPVS